MGIKTLYSVFIIKHKFSKNMSGPTTKEELLIKSKLNFDKLFDLIEQLPLETQENQFTPGTMNRNMRDVLAHIHHWHLLFMEWYRIGSSGVKPEMPTKGYSWKTTPGLNFWIWENYQKTSLEEANNLVKDSFWQMHEIVQNHSNEELFEKKRYRWNGFTSMGSYLVSAHSSHYEWAYKLIKKGMKNFFDA